ncbi:hypothetical protein K490DRAFT_66706 [Saccharata proteae CBS 121410]|uniref:Uncharacterized protein n=1 Tax=Saccharata proteae CBS 121410 TaxID=1314787 RepID=A0A9P4HV57_9PEZI|nr:hypothetical protein K490DRAFT_66706 [Saccharata proteae CBS 121410]
MFAPSPAIGKNPWLMSKEVKHIVDSAAKNGVFPPSWFETGWPLEQPPREWLISLKQSIYSAQGMWEQQTEDWKGSKTDLWPSWHPQTVHERAAPAAEPTQVTYWNLHLHGAHNSRPWPGRFGTYQTEYFDFNPRHYVKCFEVERKVAGSDQSYRTATRAEWGVTLGHVHAPTRKPYGYIDEPEMVWVN